MPMFLDNPTGFDTDRESFLFKQGVHYFYGKGDDKHPLLFLILPAYEEHNGSVNSLENGNLNWCRAATLWKNNEGNMVPAPNHWFASIYMSKPFIKGSRPIVSRKTLVERNEDGTLVRQKDPLSEVLDFIKMPENQEAWGYLSFEQYSPNPAQRINAKLPKISRSFVMNVFTLNDDKPGAKLMVVSSYPAMNNLASMTKSKEGFALRQTMREISDEELRQNPSAMFEYGDITDPNGAVVFQFTKALDENKKFVNQILPAYETDPATGRQRIQRASVTANELAARVDLQHPETYVNIPTEEEQVQQLIQVCSGRNKKGDHELDMLRAALPDYANMIPQPTQSYPVASPVANTVPVQPPPAPVPVTPVAPVAPVAPAPVPAPPVGGIPAPAVPSAPPVQVVQKTATAPGYVPQPPAATAPAAPAAPATPNAAPIQNVPGETPFGQNWLQAAINGGL